LLEMSEMKRRDEHFEKVSIVRPLCEVFGPSMMLVILLNLVHVTLKLISSQLLK
jgi:hypothetical protein